MRIGDTDKWISKEAFDKRRIKYRTENGIIYIKDERLITELNHLGHRGRFTLVIVCPVS